jgi:probable rRNA maturation factor
VLTIVNTFVKFCQDAMPITFHNADIKFTLPQKAALKKFIAAQVLKEAGKKAQLSYVFCSDEYLLDINRRFLQHDYYTDIITFDLGDAVQGREPGRAHPLTPGAGKLPAKNIVSGEIYISIERVSDNAKKLKLPFEQELLRVMFHGVLHLLGHKDKTKSQKLAMRKLEEQWMRKAP